MKEGLSVDLAKVPLAPFTRKKKLFGMGGLYLILEVILDSKLAFIPHLEKTMNKVTKTRYNVRIRRMVAKNIMNYKNELSKQRATISLLI